MRQYHWGPVPSLANLNQSHSNSDIPADQRTHKMQHKTSLSATVESDALLCMTLVTEEGKAASRRQEKGACLGRAKSFPHVKAGKTAGRSSEAPAWSAAEDMLDFFGSHMESVICCSRCSVVHLLFSTASYRGRSQQSFYCSDENSTSHSAAVTSASPSSSVAGWTFDKTTKSRTGGCSIRQYCLPHVRGYLTNCQSSSSVYYAPASEKLCL